jgi:hypothetical protein
MASNRERLEALAAGTAKDEAELLGEGPVVRSQNERDITRTAVRERGVFNGTNKKLSVVTEIPGYQLRWFNDAPGRLDTAVSRSWWEYVTQDEIALGDSNKVVGRNSDVGNKVRAIVGTTDQNEPLYAYLMKIKKEWFEEDQQDSAQKIRNSEAEMLKNGGMNTDRIGEKYLPDQRRQALSVRKDTFERGGSFN